MRILIVDDEAPARRRLRAMLSSEEVIEASSGEEAIAIVQAARPDLLLLDIRMPGLDGFGVLERLAERPPVIFVTASDDGAIRAFEEQALDYLLKPVRAQRLEQAIARVRREQRRYESWIEAEARVIPVAELEWAESARNYVVVHAGGTVVLRSSLDALAARLDPERFVRISRSHLVNTSAIQRLEPMPHGERRVVLRDGQALIWTRRYRPSRASAH